MTLEQQMIALMVEHNLHGLSLHVGRQADGRTFFSSYAHGKDADGLSRCASAPHDLPTLKETAGTAIGTLNQMRAVGTVEIGALAPMGETA